MKTDIVLVEGGKMLTKFIDFPHDLYADDPNYVPMFYMEQKTLLDPKKSPFWKHSKAAYFLAKQGDKIVGRIAAIRNNNHLEFSKTKEGFFGFFDVIDDYDAAKALLDAAADWLRKEGLEKMIGPENFSTNETVGTLIDGFNEPPVVMMTYNHNYYNDFLARYGCTKYIDLNAYTIVESVLPPHVIEASDKLEARLKARGINIYKLDMKNYQEEITRFLPVYNEGWVENTGFVPMSDAEVRQIAKDLKPIVNPNFIWFAEKEGKVIGACIAIPDVNEIQKKIKRGRLFPFGFITLLTGLKKIKGIRILILGTMKSYRRLGIETIFHVRLIREGLKVGINRAEGSWILENNLMPNRAMETMGGKLYKKYRIYEKTL